MPLPASESSPELPWETVDAERAMNTQFGTVCFAESPTSELVTPMPIGKVKTVKSVAKPTMVDGLDISELPSVCE